MRARMGVIGIGFVLLSLLSTGESSAETEAATVSAALSAATITPPPADLRLENPRLRRLQKGEVTPAMLALAATLVRKHHNKPVGTLIEVELDGKRVVARIERHFHPEGGAAKPWGFHAGVSLFAPR